MQLEGGRALGISILAPYQRFIYKTTGETFCKSWNYKISIFRFSGYQSPRDLDENGDSFPNFVSLCSRPLEG